MPVSLSIFNHTDRGRRVNLLIFSTHKESPLWGTQPPRLLELFAAVCRRRHFSPRTEESYRYWIRQYIYFHDKQHPKDLGATEVEAFLNYLAVSRKVAASTQTQALNALVFLYESVIAQPLGSMGGLKRVQARHRVPVVLTAEEVKLTLSLMQGTPRLMAELMYGAGLRVNSSGTDIRTIQLLLGHQNLQTTMIYTHVIEVTRKVTSPLDRL